jgi:hypothetical protein
MSRVESLEKTSERHEGLMDKLNNELLEIIKHKSQ